MAINLDDLSGYVERDLDADLARWFSDRSRAPVPEETRPVAPMLDRLPPTSAAALAAVEADFRSLGQAGALAPDLGPLAAMNRRSNA
ncbi:hypothetical protein ACFY3U_11845 [Micromonospora sp. NPDC000089]|uniref:hypothetical protein n=1 Tax=unclassified Micromonospora TaxID=2617518 RepID=UPI00369655CF